MKTIMFIAFLVSCTLVSSLTVSKKNKLQNKMKKQPVIEMFDIKVKLPEGGPKLTIPGMYEQLNASYLITAISRAINYKYTFTLTAKNENGEAVPMDPSTPIGIYGFNKSNAPKTVTIVPNTK